MEVFQQVGRGRGEEQEWWPGNLETAQGRQCRGRKWRCTGMDRSWGVSGQTPLVAHHLHPDFGWWLCAYLPIHWSSGAYCLNLWYHVLCLPRINTQLSFVE